MSRLPSLFWPTGRAAIHCLVSQPKLSRLEGDALSASAFGCSEAQLRFHEGNAYTRLGEVDAALAAQDRALELCSPGDYTDWALTRLDRAICLTTMGHASDALNSLAETIGSLDEAKRQGMVAERARLVLDGPQRWSSCRRRWARSTWTVRLSKATARRPAGVLGSPSTIW